MKAIKGQLTEWEKIFTVCVYHQGLLSTTYKELLQINKRNAETQQRNRLKDQKRISKWPKNLRKYSQIHQTSRKCKLNDNEIPPDWLKQ